MKLNVLLAPLILLKMLDPCLFEIHDMLIEAGGKQTGKNSILESKNCKINHVIHSEQAALFKMNKGMRTRVIRSTIIKLN